MVEIISKILDIKKLLKRTEITTKYIIEQFETFSLYRNHLLQSPLYLTPSYPNVLSTM